MTNVVIIIGKPKFWFTNYYLLTISHNQLINSILRVHLYKEEKNIFTRLVARNANNMSFSSYRIVFVAKEDLTATVEQEVASW